MNRSTILTARASARRLMMVLVLLVAAAAGSAAPALLAPAELDECSARRQQVIAAMAKGDVLILHSGERLPGPVGGFLRDRDFFYLVGHAEEGLQLLIERGDDDRAEVTLFLSAKNPDRELWDGWRLSPGAEATALLGIAESRPNAEFKKLVEAALLRAKRVFTNHERPRDGDPPAGVVAMITALRPDLLPGEDAPRGAGQPSELIAALRQVKSAAEMVKLQKSIDITAASLAAAIARIRPGMGEYQVQTMIEAGFRWRGAEDLGFRSIVGAGINGTTLHYSANRAEIEDGDLIVMDVGAEYRGYSADITRTVPANGKFTPRQRELYEIVLAAQRAGFAAARPGNTIRDVHRAAKKVIEDAGYGEYFPHGTSHWLGLDVHDTGNYDAPLAPGMVLTVEPGIYIPAEAIGIRIEDDVLITKDGNEILSHGVPREIAEIEALMKSTPPARGR